ncbi:MAG: VOC family protein [Lentisphaeraceae bacterium]|nr:VOC family protein [Lentisphaeraceae bacterium]
MIKGKNPVNWFEIPVKNISRAKDFYESILGYPLNENDMGDIKMAWFPIQEGQQGAAGTLVEGNGYEPSTSGTLVYINVEDIETTLDKIIDNGGKVIRPKMNVGEYGYVAHFEDIEGNRVALHSQSTGSEFIH